MWFYFCFCDQQLFERLNDGLSCDTPLNAGTFSHILFSLFIPVLWNFLLYENLGHMEHKTLGIAARNKKKKRKSHSGQEKYLLAFFFCHLVPLGRSWETRIAIYGKHQSRRHLSPLPYGPKMLFWGSLGHQRIQIQRSPVYTFPGSCQRWGGRLGYPVLVPPGSSGSRFLLAQGPARDFWAIQELPVDPDGFLGRGTKVSWYLESDWQGVSVLQVQDLGPQLGVLESKNPENKVWAG